jgi:hypothetical protein
MFPFHTGSTLCKFYCIFTMSNDKVPVPVGLGHLVTGIVGSNPARGKDVCLCVVLSCVRKGLSDGLITRPKESYEVSQ